MGKGAMKRTMKSSMKAGKGAMKRTVKSSTKAVKGAMKRTMKAKRVSKVARGCGAMSRVLRGIKAKTAGGLTANDLMRNSKGKVVSKKRSAANKKNSTRILK